jgi:hypothetical protein
MGATLSALKQLPHISVRPPTKIALGQQNIIEPMYEFEYADQVPFDPVGLFSYLMSHAERRFIPATAQEIAALFEELFSAAVPDTVIRATSEALQSAGMADAGLDDDLRRNALVELFVHQYTYLYMQTPTALPNPATARISYTDWLSARFAHR